MKQYLVRRLYAGILCFGLAAGAQAQAPVQVENLLRGDSQLAEGVEVIVSVIEIGPGFILPKHYHPGEEFVYVPGGPMIFGEGRETKTIEVGDFAIQRLPVTFGDYAEFVYVLEGEATLWQQGKPDLKLQAGEVYKIPLEQVHTAMTGDSAARAIVFRVHRKGAPDRIPVE